MGGAPTPEAPRSGGASFFEVTRSCVLIVKRIRPRGGKGKCNLSMWRIGIRDAETLLR